MEILVIGAGIAGLTCARRLMAKGHTVTVVDKGRGIGGRLATRRIGAASFDTGAQFISAREPAFAKVLTEAGATVWCQGFPVLGKDSAPDGHPRYRMPGGMNQLAKSLAQGVHVRDQLTVTGMVADVGRWQVTCTFSDGAKPGSVAGGPSELLTADAVVLTAPAPQAASLLAGFGIAVPEAVLTIRYDPCLCLLLDFPSIAEALLPVPGGIQIIDDPAIGWISSQRAKGLRISGDGLVIHANGRWSAEHYHLTDAEILVIFLPLVDALLRRLPITTGITVGVITGVSTCVSADAGNCQVKKWRYSLPTVTIPEPCVRVATAVPLILAGDSFGNRPRVEGAWLSGCAAAEMIG